RVDPWVAAKSDRDTASTFELGAVELQPPGLTSTGQATVRDDDVSGGTGSREGLPVDPCRRSGGQQPPLLTALAQHRDAGVARAIANPLPLQQLGVAFEA